MRPFLAYLLGMGAGFVLALVFGSRRLRREGRLPLWDEHVLRRALSTWANEYAKAAPSARAKDREVQLFEACTHVGLMWIAPRADRPKCTIPPPGWGCSRKPGHLGPCAAYPVPRDSE